MTELATLIKKRGIIKGQLTRFNNFLDNYAEAPDEIQLSLRKQRFEDSYEQFNSIQMEIELSSTDMDQDSDERDNFESGYFEILARAENLLAQTQNTTGNTGNTNKVLQAQSNTSQQTRLQLPIIKLHTFNGSYDQWTLYCDSFNSLVASNTTLSKVDKFQYLRASLSGEALDTIHSLETSENNYDVAWDLLKRKYNRKRAIVQNHIKALHEIAQITKESYSSLRGMTDTFQKHIRALESLNVIISNPFILYHLSLRLDTSSKREWEQSISKLDVDHIPTMVEFQEFLEQRCQFLESLEKGKVLETKPFLFNTQSGYQRQDTHAQKQNKAGFIKRNSLHTSNLASTTECICLMCKGQHQIFKCEEFLKLTPKSRYEKILHLNACTNCLKIGHFSKKCNSSTCRQCSKRHNTLLHFEQPQVTQEQKPATITVTHSVQKPIQIILSTAIVKIEDYNHKWIHARALLDSGSQSNFITKDLLDKLQLASSQINISVHGINQALSSITQSTKITFMSIFKNYKTSCECLVVNKITNDLPQAIINKVNLNIPQNIFLADDNFNIPGPIDLLIGAEKFWELLCIGQIKLGKNEPILQKTQLGWVVAGPMATGKNNIAPTSHLSTYARLEQQVKRFWQLDDTEDRRKWTSEEIRCEEIFKKTVQRNQEGRFIVALPKREEINLGDSFEGALRRYTALNKRLENDSQLQNQYNAFLQEYQDLGHMQEVETNSEGNMFYLPHHPVIKQSSLTTKVRVVFDGSFKTSSGQSLNDNLLVGPTVQRDLFDIITRFRTHKYVITADIAMMFRQINIREEDRNLQRILWKKEHELKHFTLNTVTYGTASAPYLAQRCLKQLALEDGNEFLMAKEALERDFYMDDVLTGSDTIQDTQILQKQLQELLSRGKFDLRKWRSNSKEVLSHLQNSNDELLVLNKDCLLKTLGVLWHSTNDTIHYTINQTKETKVNKRTILSQISQIFDPLGLIGPILIKGKIIMQRIWQLGLNWDESVPQSIYSEWYNYRTSLSGICNLNVPRNINPDNVGSTFDIHGFCDSSESAYGACLYASCTSQQGLRVSRLICSKARVVPIKRQTLPRLELCGALVLARLTAKIQLALEKKIRNIYLWSDSMIVLAWLKTQPNQLKSFVANRVSEITQLVPNASWQHVNSQQNPADLISRGTTADILCNLNLWWTGPHWLSTDNWPDQNQLIIEKLPEIKISTLISTNKESFDILTRYSSILKLQRVIAYCVRFSNNCRKTNVVTEKQLTLEELENSLDRIIKLVQEEEFNKEIVSLRKMTQTDKCSSLASLHPFIDEKGLLRVGGRLEQADIPYDQKHPLILPNKHHITTAIIRDMHLQLKHCSQEQLLAQIRLKYWPIAGRRAVRRVIHNCIRCFRYRPKITNYIMGNLPKSRIEGNSRPFTTCGVDYAGPIQLRESRRRGRVHINKAYIAVFVCFASKAVHLEIVSDLSTEAFLAAFRRFVARRGVCKDIYSDNGTNFVGANRKLKELYQFLRKENDTIKHDLTNKQIQWHHIPPRCPHFGGLWEAAVKATKTHLIKVIQNIVLTWEECSTVLTEIEAVLNSRPLTPLSSSPNDLTPLTPSHFLIGDLLLSPPELNYTNTKKNLLSRWEHLQKIKQHFWQRWSKEYLHQLQARNKWKTSHSNLPIGTMVIMIEQNLPSMYWKLGRILETYPGKDGVVRVALVKTANGEFKRSLKYLCVLPDVEI